jgi:gliding motility-associated lipoprotein GldH
MKKKLFLLILSIAAIAGCTKTDEYQTYHRFTDRTWYRFNILQFEIPIGKSEKPVNVVFFASIGRDYPFDSLAFNMIMKTPSGEERVKEYHMNVKDRSGKFLGTFRGDSCEMSVILKKEMVFGKEGILAVELENLVPRLRTTGLNGVGIRIEKP